jgi:glycerophosphoryl diester phosphodiesterase
MTAVVVAHRGASAVCPENTHAAFAAALRMGADGIELDLQLSADDRVVVYHDGTLAKVGGRGRVRERTLAELRRLDVGGWFAAKFAGERMPTLEEVLDRYGARTLLCLEIKLDEDEPAPRRRRLVHAVVDAVRRAGVGDRVRILSFWPDALALAARRAPQLCRVLDCSFQPRSQALLRRGLRDAAVLCLPARLATRALGERVRGMDRELWVYRCDTERTLAQALRAGVSGIITDRPDWARSRLRSRERVW